MSEYTIEGKAIIKSKEIVDDMRSILKWLNISDHEIKEDDNGEYSYHFSASGYAGHRFGDDVLKVLSSSRKTLICCEVIITTDSGTSKYIWNSEDKQFDVFPGVICYTEEDAEREFPKEIPYDLLKQFFVSYVENDLQAADPYYVRDALEMIGVGEEEAKAIGLGYVFEIED